MNDDNIENHTSRLLKMAKDLWVRNVITTEGFNRLTRKISNGDLEHVEKILMDIDFEKKDTNDNIKDEIKNNLSLEDYYEIKENYKKEKDELLRKCNQLQKTYSILSMENEKNKELHERLTIENDSLRKVTEKLATENITIKEAISKIQKENSELKNKHQQSRIDEKIPDYVKDVSQKLDVADKFFSDMSRNWSIAGLILALCAVASAFCTFFFGLDTILDNQKLTPTVILYTFVRGGLGIALLSWVSYISFSNARNYTHESILRKDRQHALTFGRLFLQIYGSTASKEDAIHVFKDWNMSGDTAFSSKSSAPPSPLSYIDTIKNALSKASATTKSADKTNE